MYENNEKSGVSLSWNWLKIKILVCIFWVFEYEFEDDDDDCCSCTFNGVVIFGGGGRKNCNLCLTWFNAESAKKKRKCKSINFVYT